MSTAAAIHNFIDWLNAPELVAKFQRSCGIVSVSDGNHGACRHSVMQKRQLSKHSNKYRHINGYGLQLDASSTGSIDSINYICNGNSDDKHMVCACKTCQVHSYNRKEVPKPSKKRCANIGHRRELSTDLSDSFSDSESESYIVTNKFLHYLFMFSAGLGNEMFYASAFPFWLWNVDGSVGRRVIMIWVYIMYFGQAAKDIICWPRPSSPPVTRIEKRYALEYGMPSTHAMVGAAVPFSILIFTMFRYEYDTTYGIVAAIVWCTLVSLSRLYMGMHSVLDVLAGLALVAILMAILLPFVDMIDSFQLRSAYSPWVITPATLIMSVCYPTLDKWSTARGDTIVVLGTGAGFSFGSWLNYQLGILQEPLLAPPYTIIWPTFHGYGLMLLRTSIGVAILVATRAILKTLTFTIMCYLLNIKREDSKRQEQLAFELPIKFITYMGIGINVIYLSPQVFHILNIDRETWYTEV